MRLSLFIVALAVVALPAAAAVNCAECHASIAESYSRTAMARSFRAVTPSTVLPEFDGKPFDHAPSRERFFASRRDTSYSVRRESAGGSLEVSVDYIFGSGDHARSYLHRTKDGRLVEMPVTWYAENGGHWGMSPAYDRPDHAGFSRQIDYRCMFCHNAYPALPGGADKSEDGEFPLDLPNGIDCARCHGNGEAHAHAARAGKPVSEIRAAIVNPARLTPERQLEVCMQCHYEPTSTDLPSALTRLSRGVFSYQPGEPLANYILYFDSSDPKGRASRFELVSAAFRLRGSACFRASAGRLTCTTCHDPHRQPTPAEVRAISRRACQSCHPGRDFPDPSKRAADDAIHISVTDHLFSGSPPPGPTLEINSGNTMPYAGEVRLSYPDRLMPGDEVYLAIAQVADGANSHSGIPALRSLLDRSRDARSEAWRQIGQAYASAGIPDRAASALKTAIEKDPRNWRAAVAFAEVLASYGQPSQAITLLDRARVSSGDRPEILETLAVALDAVGDHDRARTLYRDLIASDPENALAWNDLGKSLLASHRLAESLDAFHEAVRLQPESIAIRLGYASALFEARRFPDARLQLEEAIRIGPSPDRAIPAWFHELAATGDAATALARFKTALNSQLTGARINLGYIFLSIGDRPAALRQYEAAVAADPNSPIANVNLGLTLLDSGDRTRAEPYLTRAAHSSDPAISTPALNALSGKSQRQ